MSTCEQPQIEKKKKKEKKNPAIWSSLCVARRIRVAMAPTSNHSSLGGTLVLSCVPNSRFSWALTINATNSVLLT
jgi:hypothetical protein